MNARSVKYLINGSILAVMIIICSFSQRGENERIRVAFYNTENLFDTIDSPLDDNEFLPNGTRHWTSWRYYHKLDNIFRVLVMCGGWSPPEVIGLCEIENEKMLNELAVRLSRNGNSYGYIYSESADSRGIGVGMLFNRRYTEYVGHSIFYPVNESGDTISTRSILSVILYTGSDTINFMVSHWPSLRGGELQSLGNREEVALLIKEQIARYMMKTGCGKLILSGDFNSQPGSGLLVELLGVSDPAKEIDRCALYNMSSGSRTDFPGSYKYQGEWALFDQIIVSGSLLNTETSGFYTSPENFRIIHDDILLTGDARYSGMKPLATWSGFNYTSGYSDHLPVIIDLFSD